MKSKQAKQSQHRRDHDHTEDAGELITLRVRPGKRPGRAKRMHGMYSPMTKEETDQVRPYRSLESRGQQKSQGRVLDLLVEHETVVD